MANAEAAHVGADRFRFLRGPGLTIALATDEPSARWLVARPLRHERDRQL
jgi:hypothetical protein